MLDANQGLAQLPDLACGGHRVLQVARLDALIHDDRGLAEALEKYQPADLDSWLVAFEGAFEGCRQAGAAGFKTGMAYNRRICYSDPSKDEVSRIFERGILEASPEEKTIYQDFMMNRLCRLCAEADVPLQIHTGIQAGIGGTLEDTRPTLLTELFRRHEGLRFDVLHGGYPWCVQGGLMAKYFPNVYIDGCWLSHISPSAYRAALTSWLETVPMNKILAWGGDHTILEQSYASLMLAKDLISDVLAEFVRRGYFDSGVALTAARRILYENGAEFWGLAACP